MGSGVNNSSDRCLPDGTSETTGIGVEDGGIGPAPLVGDLLLLEGVRRRGSGARVVDLPASLLLINSLVGGGGICSLPSGKRRPFGRTVAYDMALSS